MIFVVTDGEDNSSRDTLEKVVQLLQQEGSPTVYTSGLLGDEEQPRARRALQILAERTGGIAFFSKTFGRSRSDQKNDGPRYSLPVYDWLQADKA